ncbi:MAG: P27 family phage terminase small subunit [Pseudomonadota bacterium]
MKLIQGNPGKRALNKSEPEPDYLNDLTPPAWLSPDGKRVWDREAPQQRRSRMLTVVDVTAFGRWCEDQGGYELMIDELRSLRELCAAEVCPEARSKLVNRMINLQNWISMYCKRLAAVDREFGRTPAARTRINTEPQGDMFGSSAEEKYLV